MRARTLRARTLAPAAGASLGAALGATLLVTGCSDASVPGWVGERVEARPAVDAEPTMQSDSADVLCVDTARSRIRWRGTKVGGKHEGIVRLSGGRLLLRDGEAVGGDFTVDMRSIAVTDIPPHEVVARRQLRSHLSHEEFFGVERFPTASFVITGLEGGEHGLYDVAGNLAIRDSVHNVSFQASAPVLEGDRAWATASFSFDRRRWGIDFNGATSALRNAIVHDRIQLRFALVADRRSCT